LQARVAFLCPAQIALRIEIDIAENAFQLLAVGVLNGIERDIDQFADIGSAALIVEGIKIAVVREYEALTCHTAADALLILAILLAIQRVMIVPHIRNIFEEQHYQDIVFVLGRIDRAPERVTGAPENTIDLILADHFLPLLVEERFLNDTHYVPHSITRRVNVV
jgi:hypothetical protein